LRSQNKKANKQNTNNKQNKTIMKFISITSFLSSLMFITTASAAETTGLRGRALSSDSNGNNRGLLMGGHQDEHGCIGSAGYTWCPQLSKCVQPFQTPCPTSPPGGDKDQHGCVASEGYEWCPQLNKCVQPFQTPCPKTPPGGDMDQHGCVASEGYEWCPPFNKCVQPWATPCVIGNSNGNNRGLANENDDTFLADLGMFPENNVMKSGANNSPIPASAMSKSVSNNRPTRVGQIGDIVTIDMNQAAQRAQRTITVAVFNGVNPEDISWKLIDQSSGKVVMTHDFSNCNMNRDCSASINWVTGPLAGDFEFVLTSKSGKGMVGNQASVKILDATGRNANDLTGKLLYKYDSKDVVFTNTLRSTFSV